MMLPVLFVLLLVSSSAFAQVSPSPLPPVTTTTGIIMGLSALLGILTNWIQTGTLLGRWIPPQSWLPDATMLVTFLGGFLGFIQSQTPVTLSGSAIFYGVLYGIAALTAGVAPALAKHVHGPLNNAQRLARLAAKPPAPPAPIAGPVAAAASMLVLGFGLMSTQSACKEPLVPTVQTILQVVSADIQAGDGAAQIDSDVCKALGGSATTDAVCADATVLIQDAITLLIDSGTLSAAQKQTAQAYFMVHPKAAAATGGGK
jgi:hypothetical protein